MFFFVRGKYIYYIFPFVKTDSFASESKLLNLFCLVNLFMKGVQGEIHQRKISLNSHLKNRKGWSPFCSSVFIQVVKLPKKARIIWIFYLVQKSDFFIKKKKISYFSLFICFVFWEVYTYSDSSNT